MRIMRKFPLLVRIATHIDILHRIDFEDTYDGLGDQLEETNDDFNDDTFGGDGGQAAANPPQNTAKDFDYFGQTAKVSDAINEEQLRFSRHQPPVKQLSPPSQASKPYKTGYESYKRPEYQTGLQANASLWGTAPDKAGGGPGASTVNQSKPAAAPAKKMMSLEEVEAAMRSQAKNPAQA